MLERGEQAGLLERTALANDILGPNPENPAAQTEVQRLADTQRELTRLAEENEAKLKHDD